MLVLFLAVLLLVVAPAMLLWIGKLIESRTNRRHVRVRPGTAELAADAGGGWFREPMRPAFTWGDLSDIRGAGTQNRP